MKKIICFVRVSTDTQSYDAQLKELVNYAKSSGYKDEEIMIIEGAGASAIKINDLYKDMIDKVQEAITTFPSIEAVYLWSLDRFGRDDEILISMKNWFIKNKINLIIKNPSLVLLNPDKTLNNGTEITYNVLAAIAKQEMKIKFERFARSKAKNKEEGRYNGGQKPFGYIVDKNGYFQIDPNNIILEIFTLYSTGNYSYIDLAREFKSRGFLGTSSDYIVSKRICAILHNKAYYGERSRKGMIYPPLITKELFDKCAEIGHSKSFIKGRLVKKNNDKVSALCRNLIKCQCGHSMVANNATQRYICVWDNFSLNKPSVDSAVWFIICPLYASFLLHKDDARRTESLQEIESTKNKIKVCLNTIKEKEERLDILDKAIYVLGKVKVDKGEKMKSELQRQIKEEQKQVSKYNEQVQDLLNLIGSTNSERTFVNASEIYNIKDPELKYDILHEYVNKIVPIRISRRKYELHIFTKTSLEVIYKINTHQKLIEVEEGKWIKLDI